MSYLNEKGDVVPFPYNPMLDLPNSYGVGKPMSSVGGLAEREIDDCYIFGATMQGVLNGAAKSGDTSTNYLHWSDGVTDTIVCTYSAGENYLRICEVVINGKVLWQEDPENISASYIFKIVIGEDGQRTISVIYPYAEMVP